MSRSWTFTLHYARAPKGLSANDRCHWQVKRKSVEEVRAVVADNCANLPRMDRVRVDVAWIVKDKIRRDTDNLAPFLKAIYDGIGADKGVSAHVVPDDAPEFMEKIGASIRYEHGATPHFEVTVTEIPS